MKKTFFELYANNMNICYLVINARFLIICPMLQTSGIFSLLKRSL
jgi:hypothetical protein